MRAYMSRPKQRKIFLPRLSESLLTRGIKIILERENPARITPNQIPVAPRLLIYIGIRGAMIPNPTIAVNRESGNTTNTLFISINDIYPPGESQILLLYCGFSLAMIQCVGSGRPHLRGIDAKTQPGFSEA